MKRIKLKDKYTTKWLTNDVVYHVQRETNNSYEVLCDDKILAWYSKEIFDVVGDFTFAL